MITLIIFVTFLSLSGIHFYWAIGGRWGNDVSIPTNEKGEKVLNPKMVECLIVGIGLLGFGIFVLIESNIIDLDLPIWLSRYGLWAIAVIFILRSVGEFKYIGFFKKIKHTRFGEMDTKYYSPLCLMIGILLIILELKK